MQEALQQALDQALSDLGAPGQHIRLERPKDADHGDFTSNIAMVVAKVLRRPPRQIAQDLAGAVAGVTGVHRVEVAGPGFLNFFLDADSVGSVLTRLREEGESYGRSDLGRGQPIMVEFVSANPTGPLHLGHGRQAALGDGIASLLEWTGWKVHREFYFNDAGKQMEKLAHSVWIRYQQSLGVDVALPDDGYKGEYIRELADSFRQAHEDRYLNDDSPEVLRLMERHAVKVLRAEQMKDLEDFGVHFDEWYRESSLYEDGRVEATVSALKETGLTYEKDGALWLETTRFGDQKDRVMLKSDGSATYFLPDVAYHMSKWERGFTRVVNVQGSDHHGTVDRVRAGLQALGRPEGYPEYVLHQMVTVERGGQEVRFSKRAGSYATMGELVEQVGVDVARYFFLMRRPEAHLSFDLDMALDQSDKNPVYKIQYAHARMCSIFARAAEDGVSASPDDAHPALLTQPAERELLNQLAEFPETVARAARDRAPHVMCDYLERTAGMVNSWYHAGNPSRNPELAVLVPDPGLSAARMALADGIRIVLRNGLATLGVTAPERMDRQATA
ncbi:MAG: arginine--tRNA ligase [Gemmatimonadetes bacterium]|nr:arginine--tRNA ligase [Gemmatimonadota bacterium]